MADSAAVQTFAYAADLLKFFAVPAALIEVLPQIRREEIERRIIKWTKSTWRLSLWLFLPAFLGLQVLAHSAPVLVPLFIVGLLVLNLIHIISLGDTEVYITIAAIQFILFLIFALCAWIVWLLPDAWLTALFFPVEKGLALLRWLNPFWLGMLLPDFNALEFIAAFRRSVASAEGFFVGIWSGFKNVTTGYVFFSDGLVFLVMLLLEFASILFFFAAAALVVLAPLAAFVLLSETLKNRFDATQKGTLPLGAVVLWAAGETLNTVVSSYKYFWTAG